LGTRFPAVRSAESWGYKKNKFIFTLFWYGAMMTLSKDKNEKKLKLTGSWTGRGGKNHVKEIF